MEEMCQRFPLVAQKILNHIDNGALVNFKAAGRNNAEFLRKERFYWLRIIKRYNFLIGELQEIWNKVVRKSPVEIIRELAIAVNKFPQAVSKKCRKAEGWSIRSVDDFVQKLEKQWHPLFIGAACGTVNLCNHIIQKTGDIEPLLKSRGTPLHLAAMNGNLEVVRFFMDNLVDSERRKTVLNSSVFGGNLNMCKVLIEEFKADVNHSDYNGITPLHIASKFGHLEICKFLCKYVMDKNALDNNGKTPLDLAVSERNWEIVRFQKISVEKIGSTFRFVHVGLKL